VVTYEVQQISLLPEGLEQLRGFALDAPPEKARGNIHVLHLIGWIVARNEAVSSIEVLYRGRVIKTAPVRGTRPDVVEALGDIPADTQCSFHALLGLVGLEPEARLELRAALADGARVGIGTIVVKRGPVESDFQPTLQPLMLTCLGRTGSTWVMKLLAAHEQVILYRRFPYESAPAKYWLHMLKVLSGPGNLVESADPDTFQENPWWVGQNPYHDESVYERPSLSYWFGRAHVDRLAGFCQRNIEDWYMTLARSQEQETPLYFAEKHMWPTDLPVLAWELYPRAKEVFLVRDFRDMACSILAFDRERGFAGFGRPEGTTDEEYLRRDLRRMALDMRESWQSRGERGHLLRYEDLVFKPDETLASLLGYLELDFSPATIERMVEVGAQDAPSLPGTSITPPSLVEGHRTTSDLKSSIGRWRHEGDSDFRDLCDEVFSDVLADFGYAESGYIPA
jgi:hypothetical protein